MLIGSIVVGLVVLFFIILLATDLLVRARFHRVHYPKEKTANYYYEDYRAEYPRTCTSFLSGKNRLQGYFYGEGNTKGVVVFAHGIGAGHENYLKELLWLVDRGYRVFTYDATGCCTSEGKSTTGLCQSLLDLQAALCHLEQTKTIPDTMPIYLMGHSWGGYAAAAGLALQHPITASASIAGYDSPIGMMIDFSKKFIGRATVLLYPFLWLDMHLRFGRWASVTATSAINRCDTPILVIHGKSDELVDFSSAAIIANAPRFTNPNAQTYAIDWEGRDGHGSIFYNRESAAYIRETAAAFDAFRKAHNGNLTGDACAAFFAARDCARINLPNTELMEEIDAFFTRAKKG